MMETSLLGGEEQIDRTDVLSGDEECALSLVRSILANIRERGLKVNIAVIGSEIVSAGASRDSVLDTPELGAFHLRGARFSLCFSQRLNGGIEVKFQRNLQ
jgi:hypothetical protein